MLLNSSPMPAGIGCALRGARFGWKAAAAQPARRMRRETPASPARAIWLAHASAQIRHC
jgi:hypothetical protein